MNGGKLGAIFRQNAVLLDSGQKRTTLLDNAIFRMRATV
jgi:hypothetical protein